MTEYLLSTRDWGRGTVDGMTVYVEPLAKPDRDRAVMRGWVRDVMRAYRNAPNAILRGIVWELGSERPRDLRDLYEHLAREVAGVRWFLVAGQAVAKALAREDSRIAGVNQMTHQRDVEIVTPSELEAAVVATVWPTPEDPAHGGSGRRVGRSPHVPWDRIVTEAAAPIPVRRTDDGLSYERDEHGMLIEEA